MGFPREGFVGVDISLLFRLFITRNILLDLQAGRFSFGHFYVRRTGELSRPDLHGVALSPAPCFARRRCSSIWPRNARTRFCRSRTFQYWREIHQYLPELGELALLPIGSLSLEEQFYLFCSLYCAGAGTVRAARFKSSDCSVASFCFRSSRLTDRWRIFPDAVSIFELPRAPWCGCETKIRLRRGRR